MEDDSELLSRYARHRSQDAFAELMRRHLNVVYSTALRQVGDDRHRAEDVTQMVFSDLARKSARLAGHKVLAGWLHTATRFAAAKVVRTECRRRARDEKIQMLEGPLDDSPSSAPDWSHVRVVLDSALAELGEKDREAILLRFFHGRSLAEIGADLALTGTAARSRVDRALDRLRICLARRGVTSTTTALAFGLGQQSVVAAPAGLAETIGTAVQAGAIGSGGFSNFLQFMTTTQKTVTTLVAASLIGGAIFHRTEVTEFEARITALEQRNAALGREGMEARQERDELARQAQARTLATNITPTHSGAHVDGNSILAKVTRLRELLAAMPERSIPELEFLQDQDWIKVAADSNFDSDGDIRKALSDLRLAAKQRLLPHLSQALRGYTAANGGLLPTEVSQLAPYLDPPVSPQILDRYQMLISGTVSDSVAGRKAVPKAIGERSFIDDEYDTAVSVDSTGGYGYASTSAFQRSLEEAVRKWKAANPNRAPTDRSELLPYMDSAVNPAKLQEWLAASPSRSR